MKLKTLKDLPHYNFEGILMENGVAIDTRNLKAEAIKWVKAFDLVNYKIHRFDFMRFFNISEEDLK